MYNQYQNNNVCDLDSISVHDMEFDLNNSNGSYGQFTYGDYLQELQELEQGRTPMKIDRQAVPRDLTNLHWLHNVGVPVDQSQRNGGQQTITLMVDPNTNMPVQFAGNRTTIQTLPPQGIAYMTMPQTQVAQLQHPSSAIYSRHDLHHQQSLIHHHQQQHHKYASEKGKENGNPGHKVFPKPVFSYSCLIAMALRNSDQGSLPVSEIYKYMQ